MVSFGNDWDDILKEEFEQPYYLKLRQFLKNEYSTKVIYPSMYDIYNAFKFTDYNGVKVVILGQDPYHGEGEAHGLSFSVKPGIAIPPSLRNIYKELHDSLGCYIPNNGYLEKWAKQGVLLLNTALTVQKDMANSHRGIGWEIFTDKVIKLLNEREKPVIFMLWGNNAKSKLPYIDTTKHKVLLSVHPSPLSASRGFFGCGHFKYANEFLESMGETPVDWQIENI
ncbi:MAG: uracil-DNA glycosylase [Ruminococcaceae bacterium]|nr:uracil-DNA glycosylase [Oscillospiraceae bacterium]